MRKYLKVSLAAGILSWIWLLLNLPALIRIKQRIPNAEEYGNFIFLGLIASFCFHIFAFIALFKIFRFHKNLSHFGKITLLAGVVSSISIFFSWTALTDIGHDFLSGILNTPEWTAVFSGWGINMIFYALFALLVIQSLLALRQKQELEIPVRSESLFLTIQYAGLCCSIIGLGFIVLGIYMKIPSRIWTYILVPYCILILFPYGIFLISWVLHNRKECISDWYDEKQIRDMLRASAFALFFSIPGLGLVFLYQIISGNITFVWFPFYIFLILFLFSSKIIHNFRS
jgi:hypothetical protein